MTVKTPYLLACMLFASAALAHEAADTPDHLVQDMPMQAYPGYFIERCIALKEGQTLELSFDSPYPLALNIHFHTESSTEYLIDTTVSDSSVHAATIPDDGEYCVEITNNDRRDASYVVSMELNIS